MRREPLEHIDGEDIRTVTLKSLRDRIGFVQQDVYLFSGSCGTRDRCCPTRPPRSLDNVACERRFARSLFGLEGRVG